jgi:DNA-directed RNA polymerase
MCCKYLTLFQVRIHKFVQGNKGRHQSKKTEAGAEDSLSDEKEKQRKYLNGLIKRNRLKEVQVVLKKEHSPWSRATQAKVCLCIINCLPSQFL